MLVLLLEFAAAITVAVLRPNIEELVKENMNETMRHYGDPKYLVTKTWDDLQSNVSSTPLLLSYVQDGDIGQEN